MSNPILYASSTCQPCLEVCDFIQANNLPVDSHWVLPRVNTATYERFHTVVRSGESVYGLGGVPTLVDGDSVIRGATHIIAHLKIKYKLLY